MKNAGKKGQKRGFRLTKRIVGFFVFGLLVGMLIVHSMVVSHRTHVNALNNVKTETSSPEVQPKQSEQGVVYNGEVYHIFFHSLLDYPRLAFTGNHLTQTYADYMVTREEFLKILPELYKNNFVLIDVTSLYSVDAKGHVTKKPLLLPKGKKPLIISLDDLSYYKVMKGHGFANRLVLDDEGRVATRIETPEGKEEVTRDGDVIPLLDDFVKMHPDFSIDGAKGVVALTGYEGILGYRTNTSSSPTHKEDKAGVEAVIKKLKATGWRFASHSYTHDDTFLSDTISLEDVKRDTEAWDREVRPLVGDTDIFIGPFGQIFKPGDERREYLISKGFKMLCGVGVDRYFHFFSDSVVMNRVDVDGYRLMNTPKYLKEFFDPKSVIDSVRTE